MGVKVGCQGPVRGKAPVPPEGLCPVPASLLVSRWALTLTWGGRRAGALALDLDRQRGDSRASATIYLFLAACFPSVCIDAEMFGRSVNFQTRLCDHDADFCFTSGLIQVAVILFP